MKKSLLFLLIVLLAISTVITSSFAKDIIVYIPQVGFAGESSLAHYVGAYNTAIDNGYDFVMGDPNFDPAAQVNILENYITQAVVSKNIAGIVLQPIDPRLAIEGVKKANDAGVPVVVFDTDIEGGSVLAVVKTDPVAAGRLAGDFLVNALTSKYGEPKGKVLGVVGTLTDPNSIGRTNGLKEKIEKYPAIEFIEKPSDWMIPKADEITRDVLTSDPDIVAIYTASDYISDGVESALNTVGKLKPAGDEDHIIWVSIDGMPIGLDKIKRGVMDYTSNGNFKVHSAIATQILIDYVTEKKELKPGDVITGDYIPDEHPHWAPATVVEGPAGPVVVLTPGKVDLTNIDDPSLWGNIDWKAPEKS
ncbi:MAG: sugar ABC transporter substrate-binding protein [Atribacterota bacterium]|nr:sugar ABC transporter substrate-binding protein [Atribacterota bacterium]MDD4895594.1 sugar ABC transporter substrate-binding protein [Atribacterota bacterium]MDD5636845.1 sugar ABC transporter substrate-binding protein [Atribacterota bacterium]